MIDEHKLLRDSARSAEAQSLLDNDLLKEAFKGLEEAYIEKWRVTDALDTASREKLFLAVNVLGKVQQHLNQYISSGKLAAAQLKELADGEARKIKLWPGTHR